VFHKLKKKLEEKPPPNISNSPVIEKGRGAGQIRSLARNRIPDTHIPGPGAPAFPNGHIIDAKFPCEVSQIVAPPKGTGPGYSPPTITVESLPMKAADMPCNKIKDAKEKKDYLKIAVTLMMMILVVIVFMKRKQITDLRVQVITLIILKAAESVEIYTKKVMLMIF